MKAKKTPFDDRLTKRAKALFDEATTSRRPDSYKDGLFVAIRLIDAIIFFSFSHKPKAEKVAELISVHFDKKFIAEPEIVGLKKFAEIMADELLVEAGNMDESLIEELLLQFRMIDSHQDTRSEAVKKFILKYDTEQE